jgi:hypothetical protein
MRLIHIDSFFSPLLSSVCACLSFYLDRAQYFIGISSAQVIIKWSIDWETAVSPAGCALAPAAPNLITTMINMFLSIGTVECQSLVRWLFVCLFL